MMLSDAIRSGSGEVCLPKGATTWSNALQSRDRKASYYRARYYDANIGRFTGEDATGFASGPDFYLYARNNSVLYSDPTGLTSFQGFSSADLVSIQQAVQTVRDKLKSDCGSCAGKNAQKLLNALDGATFVFNPKLAGKDCGHVGFSDRLKHRAQIGPDAFGSPGCCSKGPSSNALPSTVLHETFHLIEHLPNEGGPQGVEKKCFGC